MTIPSPTPNVVVQNPRVRKIANVVLGTAGIVISSAVVLDVATPEFDIAHLTTPALALYGFLAGVFGLAVTTPNVPSGGRVYVVPRPSPEDEAAFAAGETRRVQE